jgi:hypothetical protein
MRLPGLVALATLALGGCAHEQPFQPQDTTTDRPFLPGMPIRLTYNPGADLRPAWLPDGSAFVYSWQQLGQPDLDRCLGIMGADGGTRVTTICNPNAAAADSADLFDAPSPSPAGELLYIRTSSKPGAVSPDHAGVFLAPLADPLNATQLLTLPYSIPGGRTHGFISTARWRSAKRLLYVGQSVVYSREFKGAPLDTLVTGLEIVEMDLTGAQPSMAVLPLTDGASSAALTATGDTLYYTLNNDSRVYRLVLTSADLTIAHDFGARGIARDVTVLGSNLVAVVGGEIQFSNDSIIGAFQADGGGDLVSVDLATGAETDLPTDHQMLFRHPEFAPGGGPVRLVAEGYAPTNVPSPTRNQLVSKVGDLYLYEAP